jgi:hypothetical protein
MASFKAFLNGYSTSTHLAPSQTLSKTRPLSRWTMKATPGVGDHVRVGNKFGDVVTVPGNGNETFIVKINGEDHKVPAGDVLLVKRLPKKDYDAGGTALRGSSGSNFMSQGSTNA